MAERLATAVLELTTDPRQFNQGLDEAEKRTRSFGASFENVGKNLQAFGQKSIAAGKTLSIGLTAPIVAVGAAAIKLGTDFNAGMANVATLIPGNRERINELKTSVQDLAIETGKSTSDLTDGLYQVVSAFGDTADSAKILGINAKASAAGLASTTDSINLTSAVTKSYGDTSAAAVQQVADLALQTVKLGQTTFPELAASMGRVTPLAAQLNVTQQELFGTMATFTGVTGGAAEVSTQLRGVLQALMAPTEDMSALFGRLGIESGQALIKQKGLQGAINLIVAEANKAGVPLQKYIGSIEGQTLALAATGGQAETYTQKIAAMSDVLGATDEAFREQTQGVNEAGFMWQQFQQQVVVVSQRLSDELIPIVVEAGQSLKPLLDGVIAGVQWFGQLPKPIKTVGVVVAGLVAAIGPLLVVIGSLATGIAAAMPVIAAVGGALGLLATGPVAIVVAAVAGLTAAWMLWGDDIKRIVGVVLDWFRATFGPTFSSAFASVKAILVAFRDFFVAAFELQMAIARKAIDTIIGILQPFIDFLAGAFLNEAKKVFSLFGVEINGFSDLWRVMKTTVMGIVNVLVGGIKAQFAFFGKIFGGVKTGLETMTGWFETAKQKIVGNSIVPDMVNGISKEMKRLKTLIVTPVLEATSSVVRSFQQMAADSGASMFALSRQIQAQREVLDQYGLVSVPMVTEKLAELKTQQGLLIQAGIPAQQAALALSGAYQQLGEAAARSGIQHAGLTAAIDANTNAVGAALNTAVGAISDLSGAQSIVSDIFGVQIPKSVESGMSSTAGIVNTGLDLVTGMLGNKLGGESATLVQQGLGVVKDLFAGTFLKAGGKSIPSLVSQGVDLVKNITSGGLKATAGVATTGFSNLAGIASKFAGPAGAIAQGVGALFGEGTTGQKIGALVKTGVRVAAGVMTGGMSEMALAAFEGVKAIGGVFKKMFTKPSADELAGRDIVKEFHKNVDTMLTETQRIEAGNEEWKKDAIFIRDAYKKIGLSSKEAEKDVLALWASSRDGAEKSKQVVTEIALKLQGGFKVPVSFEVGQLNLPRVSPINVPVKTVPMALGGFGVVNEPTLFLAGEAGPEEVAFSGAHRRFERGGAPGIQTLIVPVQLPNGRELTRLVIRDLPAELAKAGIRI